MSDHHSILPPRRLLAALVLGALVSPPAQAHGQDVLLVPIGQLLAMVAIVILLRRFATPFWVAFVAVAVALAVGATMWFVPGPYFPDWARHSALGHFLLGFAPPLLIALIVAQVGVRFGGKR